MQVHLDCPPPPGRGPAERGWSIEFLRTRTTAAALAVAMLASALAPAATLAAAYDPATDLNSMYNITRWTGASAWWAAGYTGAGVDVALIDTGVNPVEGLATPGKIINGPDLSLESQNPAFRYLDTSGHGTFMAGLIAGRDGALTAPYANAPASAYRGMAPDARIVNVKVGVADGGTDVSQVIAAINWVIQHKNDNGLNIRVINLSYGTNTNHSQVAGIDPLSYAAERAWKAGIVVVAAVGNLGYSVEGIANPAYNPYVIAVGASDSRGTSKITDDVLCGFSAEGDDGVKGPDFIAPGAHVQGLRVPNSFIDARFPTGRLGDRYFRGSGTSQAVAVVSGAIALILQKYPTITPDQVKKFLSSNAYNLRSDFNEIGAGEIQLLPMLTKTPANFTQTHPAATGTGSLNLSRGTDRVTDDGVVLSGEKDIFGKTFNAAAMAAAEAAGNSWSGGTWNDSSWSGNSWSGNSWSGNSWSGNSWSGNSWSGNSWSGNSWSGSSWSGSSWSGSSWSGSSWSGSSWSTAGWN